MRVLVVEDDVVLAYPVEQVLIDAGHDVEVAQGGNDALNALHREAFDGLVTDIRLGAGPDGWEVARRARQLSTGIRVIYMTADSAAQWPGNGVPGSVMLRKPYSLLDLTKWLEWASPR